MDVAELKQKSMDELRALLSEQRIHLRGLEFQVREGQLKQVHKIALTKKTIARILTLLEADKHVLEQTI
ncbi:MAG: 50S ribosomal protein L29 [Candidatus Magasanikbacteria bacterium CG11_big_fil_rev_8_21_14_0_20_43_7]|uniref:Large ribosomal subunit protein uL29 n=1 Tax=Candidatus Magasanikbacteria bacterium CG11_big_fil_rev_8_21_14_0_20_43_7 TaxID=1974654 RepID=A0A2H0N4E1_9BACT|nr:MAG: 50S ribosomal protein L29 [Candidatus Magasanikbacteria bacterium CG11_big_fil_rev_8_21_14_0_20_43_7]